MVCNGGADGRMHAGQASSRDAAGTRCAATHNVLVAVCAVYIAQSCMLCLASLRMEALIAASLLTGCLPLNAAGVPIG